MKIIKQKSPFEDWNLEVVCTGKSWNQNGKIPCGSFLELDSNDIFKREWSKYPDRKGISYGFVCPVCNCFTEIEDNDIPKHLKDMARNYQLVKELKKWS